MGGCTPGCTTRVNEGEERTLERPFSAQTNLLGIRSPVLANLRISKPEDTGDSESGVNGRCTPTVEGDEDPSFKSSASGKYFSLAGANPNRGSTKQIE